MRHSGQLPLFLSSRSRPSVRFDGMFLISQIFSIDGDVILAARYSCLAGEGIIGVVMTLLAVGVRGTAASRSALGTSEGLSTTSSVSSPLLELAVARGML